MKNIAIASGCYLKEGSRLTDKLDELVVEYTNVRFLMSSLDPLLDFVQDYALNNFHLIHILAADWNHSINADIERDGKMINEADLLLVIDNSKSNRIKLLVNWAEERQIPIVKIDLESKESKSYIDVLKLKIVDPLDQAEIESKINQLELTKEHAMNNGEFEIAAIIRDKIRALINRKL